MIDYNERVPTEPGRPSWRARLVKPVALVVVVAGLNTVGAFAERQESTPTDDACMTMLDYVRSAPGGESNIDASDRLRHLAGRLDDATAADAVAIREYLAYHRISRGAGLGPNELVLEPDEVGLLERVGPRLMRAARACTNLGHPELQEYLRGIRDGDDVAL